MANTQITPFQLTDQFTMDNFNQRIDETNTALQKKADTSSVYTKTETYSKTETNTLLQTKADASSVYTKTESNTTFAPAYTYGTADLTAGSSALSNGKLYLVYE